MCKYFGIKREVNMDQITRQIVELREQGHSIRAIAKELDIPKSTVHKWLRDAMHVEDAMVFSSTHADGALLVHFPFNFVCPGCGKEQNHAYFCT